MSRNANPRRTQAQRSAATRDALVVAARRLFAAEGFGGVGTEAIVRAAGLTRGAMYHQFADKGELFAAVFEAVEAEATQRVAQAVVAGGSTDPIEAMKLSAHTWLDVCADPEVHRIVLLEAPAVLGWERWRELGLRYGLGLVRGLLEHAMSVGRIRPQPVTPLAHVLIGALDEAAMYVARAAEPEQARAEVAAVIDDLVAALAVGAEPRR
jgi:AcrR family transcriptional regulator